MLEDSLRARLKMLEDSLRAQHKKGQTLAD